MDKVAFSSFIIQNEKVMALDLLKDPTNKVLTKMSLPISLGMLATVLFQVVDTYFVGTLGAKPLTALGFSSTVYFLMIGVLMGTALAVSVMVGTAFGENNMKKVKQLATNGLIMGFLLSTILSIIGYYTIEPLFSFLGAEEDVIPLIAQYMQPLYMAMPLLSIGLVAGSIARASGKASFPEMILGISGVINLVLDYAFIFGKFGLPALGIQGVAIGTAIAWAFVFVVLFIFMIKEGYLTLPQLEATKEFYSQVTKLGLPTVLAQIVAPFTLMFITFLLGKVDSNAVASFGVAGRIETLLTTVIVGICTATTPFIAQNMGAQKVKRIDEAIVYGGKAATYTGIISIVLLFIFITPIVGLFSTDAVIIDYASWYFYLVGGSYVVMCFMVCTSSQQQFSMVFKSQTKH